MNLRMVCASVVLALIPLAGCSRDPDEAVGSRESPQAVFNTLLTALEEEDFKTAVACHSPDCVATIAARAAWNGLQERDNLEAHWQKPDPRDRRRGRDDYPSRSSPAELEAERKRQEKRKRRFAVLDKHGLTKATSDALRKLPDEDTARKALARRVKDPAKFLTDYLPVCKTSKPEWLVENWGRPRLDEVAFDGDKATGKYVVKVTAKERAPFKELKEELSFVRLAQGDWRIGDWLLHFINVPWHFVLKE